MKSKKIKPAPYFPAFLNLREKKCIVVGGGDVALRKVKMLLGSGADVSVISLNLHPDLARLVKKKALHRISREYHPGDLEGAVIVIAATNVKKVNDRVTQEAKRSGALVNVVDDPGPSDFIIPSFFRRKDLTIAVSTAGKSPALARKIRTILEEKYGEEYASLLSLIGEVRSELKRKRIVVSPEIWQKAIDLDLLFGFLRSGQRKKAKVFLWRKLKANSIIPSPPL